jgi:glutathione synthase/RimK-type ligase-like ATP-grasp enzyme
MGGSGGRHVYKCETPAELQAALNNVSEGNKTIAVGPLIDISREFRVVVLDGQIKVMFEKQRQEGVWHHNLRLGALPKEVTDKKLAAELSAFALNVMDTLQARLAAVDIVQTPQGLAVMEVNSGIMLGHFSEHSPANHAQAAAVYKEIITKSLGEGPASVKIGSI